MTRSNAPHQLVVADTARDFAQALHTNLQQLVARIGRDSVVVRVGARANDPENLRDELRLQLFATVHA